MLVYVIKEFPIKTSVTLSICNQTVPYENICYSEYMYSNSPLQKHLVTGEYM